MSGWRLNSPEVSAVLGEVDTSAASLSGAVTEESMTAILTGLNPSAIGALGEVPSMVSMLISDQQARMAAIGNHVTGGRAAVANAQAAYDVGNMDMAVELQTAGLSAAETGDFSYFTGEQG